MGGCGRFNRAGSCRWLTLLNSFVQLVKNTATLCRHAFV